MQYNDMTKNELLADLGRIRDEVKRKGYPTSLEMRLGDEITAELDRREQLMKDDTHEGRHMNIEISESKDRPFRSLGDQLACIMEAGRPGGQVDNRLYQVNESRAATGLNEGTNSDGGFLVQQDFTYRLMGNIYETSKLANRCNKFQISSNANSVKLPAIDETSRATGSRWGGIRGYWAEEAGEKTASKPKIRALELNLNKLIGLCYVTDELQMDAGNLSRIIEQGFADELGFMIDDSIINGTGAGQPLGVLNSSCLVTQAKEAGQAASTLTIENVTKMWSRLIASSRQNAVWLINQDVEPQLYTMSLAVGTGGGPVYLPSGGASEAPYSTLFGRPVIPIEQCQTLGTKGDIFLADFKNGYILAEKGGLQTDWSIHVRFIYDESCFRAVLRIDGQPVLASAITPYKGSNTQSHFVTLAAR